jgi:hypothetical protein
MLIRDKQANRKIDKQKKRLFKLNRRVSLSGKLRVADLFCFFLLLKVRICCWSFLLFPVVEISEKRGRFKNVEIVHLKLENRPPGSLVFQIMVRCYLFILSFQLFSSSYCIKS